MLKIKDVENSIIKYSDVNQDILDFKLINLNQISYDVYKKIWKIPSVLDLKEEILIKNEIFKIQLNKKNIAFSEFKDFDPEVNLSNQSMDIDKNIENYLFNEDQYWSLTYKNTIKLKDWKSNIFTFVVEYLKENKDEIVNSLNIKNFNLLTPKQASSLAAYITIKLTKYSYDYTNMNNSKFDNSDVINLLREWLFNKEISDWEWNWVCRNFSSIVKAVFESIKGNQEEYNYLQNTYCEYEWWSRDVYNPEYANNNTDTCEPWHAWNSFLTIWKKDVIQTIIDTCLSRRSTTNLRIQTKIQTSLNRRSTTNLRIQTRIQTSLSC